LILGGAQRAVRRFEIDKTIHHGASGGPVVSVDGKLLGIATEGAVAVYGITGPSAPDGTDDMRDEPILGGHNIVVHREELKTFITESSGALQPYCAPNTISRASVGE
jgi:CBS domain-containing protein